MGKDASAGGRKRPASQPEAAASSAAASSAPQDLVQQVRDAKASQEASGEEKRAMSPEELIDKMTDEDLLFGSHSDLKSMKSP